MERKINKINVARDNSQRFFFQDVKRLYNSLSNTVMIYHVPYPTFNHLDYLWGKDAPELVYKKMFKYLRKLKMIFG